MQNIKQFIKREPVLIISFIAAAFTSFIVSPSAEYISYIDFKVLAILFCLMAIIAGFKKIGLFNVLAQRMTEGAKRSRTLRLTLVLICFFSSMLVTNDVSLITFVPFAVLVLTITQQKEYMIYVITMQTIAANLGSMLTPVGNPQNLYLYSFYGISTPEFFGITFPITAAGLVLVVLFSCLGKNESINVSYERKERVNSYKELIMYLMLFLLSLCTVFHLVDYKITVIVVFAVILFCDRKIFREIDYGLLATFVCFFIFVGNVGNIEYIKAGLSSLIEKKELIYSVLLSQIISNVPAAVLLSAFTENYEALIAGTDIGGLGTIIASLASLISFKQYAAVEGARPIKYLGIFTIFNVLILIVLLLFTSLI
jgi:Na+/H+ antiporter NhaD/arsenite permease-like protein